MDNIATLIEELVCDAGEDAVHLVVAPCRRGVCAKLVQYPRGIETPMFDPATGNTALEATGQTAADALAALDKLCEV